MSNFTDFVGGSGGGGGLDPRNFTEEIITASETWVAPHTGKYFVIMQGGGGAGSFSSDEDSNAQGGEGGEITHGIFDLTASENVVITIGAGGAASLTSGGNTTFGSYLTARGGAPGKRSNAEYYHKEYPTTAGYNFGTRAAYMSAANDTSNVYQYTEAESFVINFYGLKIFNCRGGSSVTGTRGSLSARGGGGAALGGHGGGCYGSRLSNLVSAPDNGGGGATTYTTTWNSASSGGDGIVHIFYDGN